MKKRYFSPDTTVNEIVSFSMYAVSSPTVVVGGTSDEIIVGGYADSKRYDIWDFAEDD